MVLRLKTEIWVQAYLRRCSAQGVYALIARKGDPDAGAVAVKNYLGGGAARLFVQGRDLDGEPIWRNPFSDEEEGPRPEAEIDAWLKKEAAFDADLWIVEVEDKDGCVVPE